MIGSAGSSVDSPARNVAILIFDDVEVLDFCGPFEVFAVTGRQRDRFRGCEVRLSVPRAEEAIVSDQRSHRNRRQPGSLPQRGDHLFTRQCHV